MYSQKAKMPSAANVKATAPHFLANKKQAIVERDSGVFEPTGESYSASRRSSACSSGCPSVCSGAPITSPNTTSSSAYSSAASTYSEIDGHRRSGANSPFEGNLMKKIQPSEITERIPFHPNVVKHPSSNAEENFSENLMKNVATSTLHKNRNRGLTSLIKKDYASSESGRRLYDQVNNRTFEKKRLLGKVSSFKINKFFSQKI